jgi:hypothetical protein
MIEVQLRKLRIEVQLRKLRKGWGEKSGAISGGGMNGKREGIVRTECCA